MKKYPWYLYIASVAIGIVAITVVRIVTGILSMDLHVPAFVVTLFPIVTVAVVSVWAFLLPRKMYDKKRNAGKETP